MLTHLSQNPFDLPSGGTAHPFTTFLLVPLVHKDLYTYINTFGTLLLPILYVASTVVLDLY